MFDSLLHPNCQRLSYDPVYHRHHHAVQSASDAGWLPSIPIRGSSRLARRESQRQSEFVVPRIHPHPLAARHLPPHRHITDVKNVPKCFLIDVYKAYFYVFYCLVFFSGQLNMCCSFH